MTTSGVMPAASPGASSTCSGGLGTARASSPISIESRISAGRDPRCDDLGPGPSGRGGDGRPLVRIVRRGHDHDSIGTALAKCGHDPADQVCPSIGSSSLGRPIRWLRPAAGTIAAIMSRSPAPAF